MSVRKIKVSTAADSSEYSIAIGRGLHEICGKTIRTAAGRSVRKAAIVTDANVEKLYASSIAASCEASDLEVSIITIPAGERSKSQRTLFKVLDQLSANGITRTDRVIALGGGVVGDLAGFAASIHLRGTPFVQVPTSLLAMIDSSVGGKTGINSDSGKNRVGAFYSPVAVLADIDALATLPEREMIAGACEMTKHAALAGGEFFARTAWFFARGQGNGISIDGDLTGLIAENVEFKARIVAGDRTENSSRRDAKSRKILNFGHTFAHALEKVTDYKRFRHGEAVGYGILFAAELSKVVANLPQKDVNLLYDVVQSIGPLPHLSDIDRKDLVTAFGFDKKNVAGQLQWILLKKIGKPLIVDARDIPAGSIERIIDTFLTTFRS